MVIALGSITVLFSIYGGFIMLIAREARRLGIKNPTLQEWVGKEKK